MSSTLVSAASLTGASASAEPLGAEPDLGDRLLARDVDDRLAGLRERAGGLQEQRRLADARIAADEERRAAHEAAAGDPVELGDAGRDARRLVGRRRRARSSATTRPLRERARRRAGADAAGRRLPRPACSTRRNRRSGPASACVTAPQFWQTNWTSRRRAHGVSNEFCRPFSVNCHSYIRPIP